MLQPKEMQNLVGKKKQRFYKKVWLNIPNIETIREILTVPTLWCSNKQQRRQGLGSTVSGNENKAVAVLQQDGLQQACSVVLCSAGLAYSLKLMLKYFLENHCGLARPCVGFLSLEDLGVLKTGSCFPSFVFSKYPACFRVTLEQPFLVFSKPIVDPVYFRELARTVCVKCISEFQCSVWLNQAQNLWHSFPQYFIYSRLWTLQSQGLSLVLDLANIQPLPMLLERNSSTGLQGVCRGQSASRVWAAGYGGPGPELVTVTGRLSV